jgi:hypothetical protein
LGDLNTLDVFVVSVEGWEFDNISVRHRVMLPLPQLF